MVRSLFRRLKSFALRQLGVTALAEAGAATRRELDALRNDLHVLGGQLGEQFRVIGAQMAARSRETLAPLGRLEDGLRGHEAALGDLLGRIEFAQSEVFRQVELQEGITRATLDTRLSAIHALVVHLETFYGRLDGLRASLDGITSWGVDRWKVQELEGLLRHLRRSLYENDVKEGRLDVPEVDTAYPVARESHDTRFPWGAKNDNSICPRFNSRLYQLLAPRGRLAVLDLGCAGGGFVRSLIDDGHFAVGLEGCDHPKVHRLGEWGTIPHHLHTCDVTKPFSIRIKGTGEAARFDAITAWEVMEHIADADLPGLMANVANHLAPGGVFLCSVSTIEDGFPEQGIAYHQTVKQRPWWLERFAALGFEAVEQRVIGKDDWLRGSGNCRLDRHAEDEGVGFHLVLRHAAEAPASAAA